METEKSQQEQLIALIYDVREIADGRINEMVPFSFVPILRGVLCTLFATGRGNRENAKLITTFARGTRRNSFITTFEREMHARFGRIS